MTRGGWLRAIRREEQRLVAVGASGIAGEPLCVQQRLERRRDAVATREAGVDGRHRSERQPRDLCRVRAGRARQRARRGEVRLWVAAQDPRRRARRPREGMLCMIDRERVGVDLEQDPIEQERRLRAPQKRNRAIDRDARSDEPVQERVRVALAGAVTLLDPASEP